MKKLLRKWQKDYDTLLKEAKSLYDKYGEAVYLTNHEQFAYYNELLARMKVIKQHIEELESEQLNLVKFIKGDEDE